MYQQVKSRSKLSWKYCKLALSALRANYKPVLLFVFGFSFLVYLIGFLLATFLLLAYFTYVTYHVCDQLLYNPECPKDSRAKVLTPKSYGFENFESHYLTTEDNIRIHCILLKRLSHEESISCPTLIYFHGNAGNIGHRMSNAIELLKKVKCNVLMLEYRGYGMSKGTPSESGLLYDAYAALKFLYGRNDICTSKIVLFGRSLGGAVIIGVAHMLMTFSKLQNFKPAGLIIENTFTSIPDIARHLCAGKSKSCFARLFRLIPNWFYKNKFESYSKISKLTLPMLFISGLADELIPSDMMNKLFNCSSASYKEMHKFEAGSHNFTWKCSHYYTTIDNFLSTIFHPSHTSENQAQGTDQLPSYVSVDEKSPLISNEEFPSDFPPNPSSNSVASDSNSVVVYHSQDITAIENPNESSGPLLQMLDSGLIPVLISIDENRKYTELVDI